MSNEEPRIISPNDPDVEKETYVVAETSNPDQVIVHPQVGEPTDGPTDDAKAGAAMGAAAGLVTGLAAGAMLGPVGAAAGGAIGAIVGGVASGAAVQAVDAIDNDGSPNEVDEDKVIERIDFVEASADPEYNTKIIQKEVPSDDPRDL